jgi:hypothetical protein
LNVGAGGAYVPSVGGAPVASGNADAEEEQGEKEVKEDVQEASDDEIVRPVTSLKFVLLTDWCRYVGLRFIRRLVSPLLVHCYSFTTALRTYQHCMPTQPCLFA